MITLAVALLELAALALLELAAVWFIFWVSER
jgi:hypothetical protein